jgi:hypothetical protein
MMKGGRVQQRAGAKRKAAKNALQRDVVGRLIVYSGGFSGQKRGFWRALWRALAGETSKHFT